jgi:hypothetical protein
LKVTEIDGAVTHPHLRTVLDYYLPNRLGVKAQLRKIDGPLKPEDLSLNKSFWVFDRKKGSASSWIKGLNLICHFKLKSSDVYVVSRNLVAPQFDVSLCVNHPD